MTTFSKHGPKIKHTKGGIDKVLSQQLLRCRLFACAQFSDQPPLKMRTLLLAQVEKLKSQHFH